MTYDAAEQVLLAPRASVSLNLKAAHITPARPGMSDDDRPQPSICMISGVDDKNNIIAAGGFLNTNDLFGFDAESLLRKADYSEAQESEREELLLLLETARTRNSGSR